MPVRLAHDTVTHDSEPPTRRPSNSAERTEADGQGDSEGVFSGVNAPDGARSGTPENQGAVRQRA